MSTVPQGSTELVLQRVIGLPLLVLYGLGTTIGAGIYVLIGETAAIAGRHAPLAFVVAAIVMALVAATFAELVGRFPQSAGEAAYVRFGLDSTRLAQLTGLLLILAAVVAGAAITLGSAGYLLQLVDLPEPLAITLIVASMTAVAAWGIMESVGLAALMTLVETGGLLAVIGTGLWLDADRITDLSYLGIDTFSIPVMLPVLGASLIAFFAFIGFDNLVNLAEETRDPVRLMPWAIGLTLLIATALYFMVSLVAVQMLPIDELAASRAPIGLLFERITGLSPWLITLIAIVATINGIIIQIIMASRVIYGLARQGDLPGVFARINGRTRTPLVATGVVGALVLVASLYFPLGSLATVTTQLVLGIFILVSLALIRLKWRGVEPPPDGFRVPFWIPVGSLLACLGMLLSPLLTG